MLDGLLLLALDNSTPCGSAKPLASISLMVKRPPSTVTELPCSVEFEEAEDVCCSCPARVRESAAKREGRGEGRYCTHCSSASSCWSCCCRMSGAKEREGAQATRARAGVGDEIRARMYSLQPRPTSSG